MSLRLFSRLITCSLVSLAILSFVACNSDSEIEYDEWSSDGQITSFAIAAAPITAMDTLTFPALATTKFTVVNDGVYRIFNVDSLPQYTEIKTSKVQMSHSVSYVGTQLVYKDMNDADSIPEEYWNGEDSVKFIKTEKFGYLPKFKITAPDGKTIRIYTVEFNIHKTDPDSIKWTNVSTGLTNQLLKKGENKTIMNADSTVFYTLTSDGTNLYFYTSPVSEDLPSWSNIQKTNLPKYTTVQSFQLVNDNFIVEADGALYTAGLNRPASWKAYRQNKVAALLGALPENKTKASDDLLVLQVKDDDAIVFSKVNISNPAVFTELKLTGRSENILPEDFPVKGFSALQGHSLNKEYLLITGGRDGSNKVLPYTWIVKNTSSDEINVIRGGRDNLADYSKGVVTFAYNNQMCMVANDTMFVSNSYGAEKWSRVNEKTYFSPEMISKGRHNPSIIVDKKDYIWVFGGRSAKNEYLMDIWRGRLNKLAYTHK